MERGARRFFNAITIKGTRGNACRLRRSLREGLAVLLDEHQEFLRLFLLLITDRGPDVALILDRVRTEGRVRIQAVEIFRPGSGRGSMSRIAWRVRGDRRHLPGGTGLHRRRGAQPAVKDMAGSSSTTNRASPQRRT